MSDNGTETDSDGGAAERPWDPDTDIGECGVVGRVLMGGFSATKWPATLKVVSASVPSAMVSG